MNPTEIYCDGGCIKNNPSSFGGTWCFCWVSKGELLKTESGIITPEDIGLSKISNNLTELYATMKAIHSVPYDWNGTLYTDSLVTLRRISTSQSFKGIPKWMETIIRDLRRYGKYKAVLLSGHPTLAQLESGIGKRGYPVSKWNKYCDERCCKLSKDFLAGEYE